MPKVSVIISTYNHEKYIGQAIDSVLEQTYRDFEIVVVDDGSTDNTREVLKRFNGSIRYFYQNNQGVGAAKNAAILHAQGEYLAFLDSDDIWLPDRLAIQVPLLDADEKLAFVCARAHHIDAHSKVIKPFTPMKRRITENFECLFEQNFILVPTVLARKKYIDQINGFDVNLPISQDYDLWLRLAKQHPYRFLNVPLALYREHPGNISKNYSQRVRDNIIIKKKREINKDVGFFKRLIITAKMYYLFADHYYCGNDFRSAGTMYLRSALCWPFIGLYIWPQNEAVSRNGLINRILTNRLINVYFLVLDCALRCIKSRNKTIRQCQK